MFLGGVEMGSVLSVGDILVKPIEPLELRSGNTVMARVVGFRGDRVGLRLGGAVVWGRTNLALEEGQVVPLRVEAITQTQVWLRAGLENPGAEEKSLPAALREMGLEPDDQLLYVAGLLLESGQPLSKSRLLRVLSQITAGDSSPEAVRRAILLEALGPLSSEAATEATRLLESEPALAEALKLFLTNPFPKSVWDPQRSDPESSLEEALAERRPGGGFWRLLQELATEPTAKGAVVQALKSVLWSWAVSASGPWLVVTLPVRLAGDQLAEARIYIARRAGRVRPEDTVIRLSLETRTLGTVQAELRLLGERTRVLLEGEDRESTSYLQHRLPELKGVLEAAGLHLDRLEVRRAKAVDFPGDPDLGPPPAHLDRRV